MKLAIIGAGHMAKAYAKKAKEKNLTVYMFAWEKGAVAKQYADFFYPISVLDKERILEVCKSIQVDGVLSATSLGITTAAYVANKLRLNSNLVDVAVNVQNKMWVREKLAGKNYIRQPNYSLHIEHNELCFYNMNFPVIVKPVAGEGKRGVMVAYDREAFEEAYRYALVADKNKQGILIEEFIAYGKEYSVESISFMGVHQIIQVTEKVSSGPPHCVELMHNQPADIDDNLIEKIIMATNEVLDGVGWENGPTHIEVKIVEGEIYLIELNGRAGGDHIASTLTVLSTDYDYLGEVINVALGIKPSDFDNKRNKKYVGIVFLVEQTKAFLKYFANCENQKWLYEKHYESESVTELRENDGFRINYFVYCDDERPKWLA